MAKRMLIDAVHEDEQRVVVLDKDTLVEADFYSAAKAQIKGNIYLARVTRVEPSLQAAFVDFGNGKHGFLPFSEIHPDYFQIPVADREALLEDVQAALSKRQSASENMSEGDRPQAEDQTPAEDQASAEQEDAPKPKRGRKKAAAPKAAEETDSAGEDTGEAAEAPKPKRGRKKAVASDAAVEADGAANSAGQDTDEAAEAPKPKRGRKKAVASDAAAEADSAADSAGEDTGEAAEAPKPKRGRKKAVASEATTETDSADGETGQEEEAREKAAEEPVKKPRGRPRKKTVAAAVEEEVVYADTPEPQDTASEASESSDALDDASESNGAGSNPRQRNRGRRRNVKDRNSTDRNSTDRNPSARDKGRDTDRKPSPRPQRRRDDDTDDLTDADFEARTMTRAILSKKYKIQEVIKRNQVILVQAAKEERGDKGAALTTYLSLPGRYCVLMPNTHRGGGISRRIADGADRKRLKSVLDELDLSPSMSLIVRTAGAERTKQEIKRDFAYLTRTWDEIRETTLNSFAPALVYEEANLIKRAIRDVYESDTQEVLVAGDAAHKTAKAFMKVLTPSHAARVKAYKEPTPLFQAHGVEGMLESLNQPTVRLPSGGYLVFNQTEALVAVDVNSGKATRERNIEETALRTNVEAAQETARQLRLRDLAGLVVIDFIDMEENRNVTTVERTLKEALKPDRARIQVGRISQFGLMELSRQRLRPSVAEATMAPCPICQGTGYTKSNSAAARTIIRQLEETLAKGGIDGVRVFAGTDLALALSNEQRAQLGRLEETFNLTIAVAIDHEMGPTLYRCVLDRQGRHETLDNDPAEPKTLGPKTPGRNRGRNSRSKQEEERSADRRPARPDPVSEDEDEEDGDRRRRRRGKRGGRRRGKRDDEAGLDPREDKDAGTDENRREGTGEDTGEDRGTAAGGERTADKAAPDVSQPGTPQPEIVEAQTDQTNADKPTGDADKPKRGRRRARAKPRGETAPAVDAPDAAKPAATESKASEPVAATPPEDTPPQSGPKRQGWWSRVRGGA